VFTGFYGVGILLLKYVQNRPGEYRTRPAWTSSCSARSPASPRRRGVHGRRRGRRAGGGGRVLAGAVGVGVRRGVRPQPRAARPAIEAMVTALVTVAIVISIQAVGVVLVAAMLVTPAATAYLLTDRLHRMVGMSAGFGAAAGVLGAFVSLLGADLPTGRSWCWRPGCCSAWRSCCRRGTG
jgi:hypothetical protein